MLGVDPKIAMSELPAVSIVVIGRNEEKHMESTFDAVGALNYPKNLLEIIYVDSDSSDRSMEIARRHADSVFIEKHPFPSAARGRNRGLVEARHEFVHFVDGDVRIHPDYLLKAIEILMKPDIDAVSGRLREREDRGWNRIIASSRRTEGDGPADATIAGGTFKRSALLQVNGYDERLRLGEETELGERFRKAGFHIWQIRDEMGDHDYSMKGLMDYCRLSIRNGRSKTQLMFLKGESRYFDSDRRIAINNIVQNIIFVIVFFALLIWNKLIWAPFFVLFYIILVLINYATQKGLWEKYKVISFLLMNLAKPIVFLGQMAEWMKIACNGEYRRLFKQKKENITDRFKIQSLIT